MWPSTKRTKETELSGDREAVGHRWDTGWDGAEQREQDRSAEARGEDETARNQTNGTGLKRY